MSVAVSNNPPDVVLEMDTALAQFLLDNCDANLRIGLQLIITSKSRERAEPLVAMQDNFHKIRKMLIKQGVVPKEDRDAS